MAEFLASKQTLLQFYLGYLQDIDRWLRGEKEN